MNIFERAHRVGQLEKLTTEGAKFDWTNIPELPKDENKEDEKPVAKF